MTHKTLLGSIVAMSLLPTFTASAEEFLLNPSFELGIGMTPQDWNLSGSHPPERQGSTMQSTNGNYLLLIPPGATAWQSDTPAKEGEEWTFSGYIKDASSWQLSGTNYGFISIRFLGSYGSKSFDSAPFDTERARDLWFPWSVNATAPPETLGVEFYLRVVDDDEYGGGGLMFDDFSVSRVAPVPEPRNALMLLWGGMCLLMVWRRRKQIANQG